MSDYSVSYKRNYLSLFQILSEVGGLYSTISLIFSSIFIVFNVSNPEAFIIEKVYKMKRKSQTFKYYFRCCQKKYIDQGTDNKRDTARGIRFVRTEIYDIAKAAVNRHLDVVSLSKDIMAIKFLTHYLMEEYQRALLLDITLNHDIQKKRQETKEGNRG